MISFIAGFLIGYGLERMDRKPEADILYGFLWFMAGTVLAVVSFFV